MGFLNKNGVQAYSFDKLAAHGLPHGIYMRHGGVSPAPWRSLNLGGNSGDARENIIENRRRIFNTLDRTVESLFDVWQVHSDVILCADSPRPLDQEQQKADAIFTDSPDVTLFMRFADCVPIMLFDPEKSVVGLVHAGWIGTVKKILYKSIKEMQRVYGSQPQDVLAGIGPSISVDHYEVKADVLEEVRSHLGDAGLSCIVERNGATFLDLQKANRMQLLEAGVRHIEISGICTACNTNDWFSHRAENGRTGRFGALIAL